MVSVRNVFKRFGDLEVLKGVSLEVEKKVRLYPLLVHPVPVNQLYSVVLTDWKR